MATAIDDALCQRACKPPCARGDQRRDEISQHDQVRHPPQRQILLALLADQLLGRDQRHLIELREGRPRCGDDQSEQGKADGRHNQPGRSPRQGSLARVESCKHSEAEQQLPGERVEEPAFVLGIGRQVPAAQVGAEPERHGSGQCHQQMDTHEQQQHGKPDQQHDIERQDVEHGRLMHQQQRLAQCPRRLLEERLQVENALIDRIVEHQRSGDEDCHTGDQEQHVRQVELADTARHLDQSGPPALPVEDTGVGEKRGISGQSDEHLGRVGKAEVLHRHVLQGVLFDMVYEDEQQRQATEEVDPGIALRRRDGDRRCARSMCHVQRFSWCRRMTTAQ